MITQIYAPKTADEAQELVKLGVDLIGVNVGIRNEWPTILTPEKANEILSGVSYPAKKVLLTPSDNLDDLSEIISRATFDILHLIAEPANFSPNDVLKLKKLFPNLQIMRTIPVTDQTSITLAKQYDKIADYLLLDSRKEKIGTIGSTGETHDWNISKEIVASVSIPVILAGGLGPDNVAEAIAKVHPYGVDSKTKTNLAGSSKKDLEKVKQFVQIALATK
jgi:phosphoribosylanthranilate isomerase